MLLGLHAKHLGHRDAELLGLEDGGYELAELDDLVAVGQPAKRLGPGESGLHVLQRPQQLLGEGALIGLG